MSVRTSLASAVLMATAGLSLVACGSGPTGSEAPVSGRTAAIHGSPVASCASVAGKGKVVIPEEKYAVLANELDVREQSLHDGGVLAVHCDRAFDPRDKEKFSLVPVTVNGTRKCHVVLPGTVGQNDAATTDVHVICPRQKPGVPG